MTVNKVRRNGSYAPLSAHYYKDDAIDEAGESAELLYVRGLAFCADVLSDGFISERQLVRFVGVGMGDAVDRAQRLIRAGLWERVDGGYRVRSWLNWNRSRDEITHAQAKDAARKGAPKDSERPDPEPPSGSRSDSDTTPNGIRTESDERPATAPTGIQPHAGARAHSPRHSTPLQEELLVTADASTASAPPTQTVIDAEFETFWAAWPKKVSRQAALKGYRAARRKGAPAGFLLDIASRQIAAWEAKGTKREYIPHASTWLNQERYNEPVERPKFHVISNPESPWAGTKIADSDSPWAADMGWTS